MHNLVVGGGLSDSQQSSNIDIINTACDSDHYTYFFSPEALAEGGFASAATYGANTSTSPSLWVLANAVTSGVKGFVRRHKEWKHGYFLIRLYWRSNVASNNVLFSVAVDPIVPSEAFATSLTNFTVAASATATGMKVTELNSAALAAASQVTPENLGVMVVVSRVGGDALDTNTGDVYIYGIEIEYVEAKRML